MSQQELVIATMTMQEWYTLRGVIMAHDVEFGDEHEDLNVWDARFKTKPEESFAIYVGRDGWASGFAHGTLSFRVIGDQVDLVLTSPEEQHPDAMVLTKLMPRVLQFVETAQAESP